MKTSASLPGPQGHVLSNLGAVVVQGFVAMSAAVPSARKERWLSTILFP